MLVAMAKQRSSAFSPDAPQQEAIEHVHSPMLVLAGAGTGKTTVLIQRIARLIREGHARPDEILALTYTDNAAAEMRERVEAELKGTPVQGLQAVTFHAYCNVLLHQNKKNFDVLDEQDLWIFLRKRLRELNLKYFVRAANPSQFLFELLVFLRRCHDELVSPEQYAAYVARLERGELPLPRVGKSKDADELSDVETLDRCREIASVYATVEQMLKERNLGTFSHMITKAYHLLAKDNQVLDQARAHARFILVDEFQDANFAQIKIVAMLAGTARNVFSVGDPDQGIYRFRGASSAAFGLFLRQYPEAKMVVLEKNRRSVTPILRCAFSIINRNPPAFGMGNAVAARYQRTPLLSARDEDAARLGPVTDRPVNIVLLPTKDNEAEAADIAASITELKRQTRCRWRDFAVIYRSHINRDEVVSELSDRGIPFTIENMDVADTSEVRDLLACLTAIVRPEDAASLLRIAAMPQFSIRGEDIRGAIRAAARRRDGTSVSLITAISGIEGGPALLAQLDQARQAIAARSNHASAALEIVVRLFGLTADAPTIVAVRECIHRWEQKRIKEINESGEVSEFLVYLDLFREAGGAISLKSEDEDAVHLMTAHAAKGLEFDHVFIIRANQGSFPMNYREPLFGFPRELYDPDSASESDNKTLGEQEERRLFYVAVTRARDTLTFFAKQGTGKDKSPPGPLRDLMKDKAISDSLAQRAPRPFQTDMFAEADIVPAASSRIKDWFALPPSSPLNARLSATAVEAYDTCPLKFKLARDWRLPDELSGALQYGAAIHTVLLTYFEAIRKSRRLSDEELFQLFRETLTANGIVERYQQELYEAQGIEQLTGFLERLRESGSPDVLHTEVSFEIKIGDSTIAGRIDRMDRAGNDCVALVDYKTGKPKDDDDAKKSLQLSIYALAAKEKWGYQVNQVSFYNLDGNQLILTTRDASQLEQAKRKVEEVAAKIKEGNFEPKVGYHCGFCVYRSLCPAKERVTPLENTAKKAAGRAN
jgi:DNA helicase-2/ATP-dependent DNA helicase PcrA